MSVNKVILIGNLGRDPEMRYSQSGVPITNFTIATNEVWYRQRGQGERERVEQTEWHRVVAFGKLAETCKEYLSKGRQVYVEGRNQTRKWEDKDGVTRYTTEVKVNVVRFLGNRPTEGVPPEAESDEMPEEAQE